jgi:hypothetical protein
MPPKKDTAQSILNNFIGRYCMVRTYSAGVFAGTIKALDEKSGILTDARRIWYWSGAASLSQLATDGTTDPKQCKFPCPVSEVYLSEIIEIIPITDVAKASIEGVPIWKH